MAPIENNEDQGSDKPSALVNNNEAHTPTSYKNKLSAHNHDNQNAKKDQKQTCNQTTSDDHRDNHEDSDFGYDTDNELDDKNYERNNYRQNRKNLKDAMTVMKPQEETNDLSIPTTRSATSCTKDSNDALPNNTTMTTTHTCASYTDFVPTFEEWDSTNSEVSYDSKIWLTGGC